MTEGLGAGFLVYGFKSNAVCQFLMIVLCVLVYMKFVRSL